MEARAHIRSRFATGDYAGAVEALDALPKEQQEETTTRQNAAIASYLSQKGSTSTSKLLRSLREVVAAQSSSSAAAKKGHDLSQQSAEAFTILFNMTSIHFERHHDEHARVIADSLFDKLTVASLDVGLSIKICFLLIEVNIRLWWRRGSLPCQGSEYKSAMQQRMHCIFGRLDEYMSIMAKAPPLLASAHDARKMAHSVPSSPSARGTSGNAMDGAGGSGDGSSSSSSSCCSNNHDGKHDGDATSTHASKEAFDRSILCGSLNFRILLYRSRVHMCFGRLAQASDEIIMAIELYATELLPSLRAETSVPAASMDNIAYWGYIGPKQLQAQYLLAGNIRAELDYLQGNMDMSREKLKQQETALEMSAKTVNNMACVYLKESKFHTAALFFRKALEFEGDEAKLSRELSEDATNSYVGCLHHRHIYEMLYNEGVALLLAGRPRDAFLRLQKTVPALGSQLPYLWIRMAECCIHVYNSRMQAARTDLSSNATSLGEAVIDGPIVEQPPQAEMSLGHALKYLLTVLSMIRQRLLLVLSPTGSVSLLEGEKASEDLDNEVGEYEMEGNAKNHLLPLEEIILLHIVYVHLCLEDYLLAVSTAREILARPMLREENR